MRVDESGSRLIVSLLQSRSLSGLVFAGVVSCGACGTGTDDPLPAEEPPVEVDEDDRFVIRPAGDNPVFQVHGNRSARM